MSLFGQNRCKASVFIGEVGDVFKPLDMRVLVRYKASMKPWKFKMHKPTEEKISGHMQRTYSYT